MEALKSQFKNAFDQLENLLLVFSVLVVMCVSVALIFRGQCAAWQWWLPVVACVGFCCRGGVKQGWPLLLLFVMTLACTWLFTGATWTNGWKDTLEYHFPAIRLLIEGWNPVWQGTPEKLSASLNVDVNTMRFLNVFAMPKALWYFCAEAFFFTCDPYNLFYPIFPVLFVPTVLQLLKNLRGASTIGKLAAVAILFYFTPLIAFAADLVAALAGIGLVLVFLEYFQTRRMSWMTAFCFSFWMCATKQTAFAGCFVMWVCFAILSCRSWKWLRILSLFAGVLAVFVLVNGASPYVSNALEYGHPLYPAASGDENRYPTFDFTWDSAKTNDDAKEMGHLGYFVSAYISPRLVNTYYRWKLDRKEFKPYALAWQQGTDRDKVDSPTYPEVRWLVLISSLVVFVVGNRYHRICAAIILVTLVALPTYMIGYSRYQPWYSGLAVLAILSLQKWAVSPRLNKFITCGCMVILLFIVARCAVQGAYAFDTSYSSRKKLRTSPPSVLYAYYEQGMLNDKSVWSDPDSVNGTPYRRCLLNLVLLKRQDACLSKTEIRELPKDLKNLADYPIWFRDEMCRVFEKEDPRLDARYYRLEREASRVNRLKGYPFFIAYVWFVELPKAILRIY